MTEVESMLWAARNILRDLLLNRGNCRKGQMEEIYELLARIEQHYIAKAREEQ